VRTNLARSPLNALRTDFVNPKISEHQGRIVKLTGDGMLVEFPSVVNAVACAAELQRGIRKRNAGGPQDQRIEFRIGVNVGDVIVQGEDIFGDGVNVAARLESIATPGGITISGPVRDHIGNRLDLAFEDMGEQTLKNIERPVRVFRVHLDTPAVGGTKDKKSASPEGRKTSNGPVLQQHERRSEQEYFSMGITEDIITGFVKRPIAGHRPQHRVHLQGKAVKVQQVAQELEFRSS
jgi:adenylate cyclase